MRQQAVTPLDHMPKSYKPQTVSHEACVLLLGVSAVAAVSKLGPLSWVLVPVGCMVCSRVSSKSEG